MSQQSTVYCFTLDDLKSLVKTITQRKDLDSIENLVKYATIESSGVIIPESNANIVKQKCKKCHSIVNDPYEHRTFEGDLTYSSEWDGCQDTETCPKCGAWVSEYYEHETRPATYSCDSSWECQ